MTQIEQLAEQALAIMVLDLEYQSQPLHGHAPIRHQLLWMWIVDALGDGFDAALANGSAVLGHPTRLRSKLAAPGSAKLTTDPTDLMRLSDSRVDCSSSSSSVA